MNVDELMRNKTRVRAVYASGPGTHAEGRIIGYREHPSVIIETDTGEHVSWAAHLIEQTPHPSRGDRPEGPPMTNAHAVTTEPTEFTVEGGLPVRDLFTVSCPVCGVSGPWTREEVGVWRDGHDTAVAAAAVAVEQR